MNKNFSFHKYGKVFIAIWLLAVLTGCGALRASAVTTNALSASIETDIGAGTEENRLDLSTIPAYENTAYYTLNENVPDFDKEDQKDELDTSHYEFSELDALGRCGEAFALLGPELIPTEERGPIGDVKPAGWHTVKYNDRIDGNYLYNRCHLIAYELIGVNAEERNLITGTRYLNVQGMLPFENEVTEYIERTQNHVLYRVTPVYDGDNLVASGVHMEAQSVEDLGKGVQFNVYCYDVQPGVVIDYATGDSREDENWKGDTGAADRSGEVMTLVGTQDGSDESDSDSAQVERNVGDAVAEGEDEAEDSKNPPALTYILNTNTKKFHYVDCKSVQSMKEKNKEVFEGTREEIIGRGYSPCKNCNP